MADHRLGLRSCEDEHHDVGLDVEGELPHWLDGTLFGNGPGLFEVGDRPLRHWFDGFAMLRRFRIRDGAVRYSNRFLRSEAYRSAREGSLAFGEFGTTPRFPRIAALKLLAGGPLTDNASITVRHRDGSYLAVTETKRAVAFDPETLATLGTREIDAGIEATGTLAHDHYDPRRAETIGLGTRLGSDPGYVLTRRPDGGRAEEFARIDVEEPAYMHSFALTDDHVVLTESPLRIAPNEMLSGTSFAETFRWHPDGRTRFLIVDRDSGTLVAEAETDPFFTFHHANAFEEDGEIVLDCAAFPDGLVVGALSLARLRRGRPDLPGAELRRYRIDVATERVGKETLHPGPFEFPTFDYPHRNGRTYRYLYGVGRGRGAAFDDRVLGVDLETREARHWSDERCYPGEPLYIPGPGDAENDGVLLSVVLDAREERSFLLVLDAATIEERARAWLPHALPFGFHGSFFQTGETRVPSMA
ncbi:carotenoid oxygenase family protein [Natronorarus salvus]|uniref:carotenoid oxygenase family protein n=1 Tax=Natronorarus salvus TaxID=3117733 RepID=UPI002F264189